VGKRKPLNSGAINACSAPYGKEKTVEFRGHKYVLHPVWKEKTVEFRSHKCLLRPVRSSMVIRVPTFFITRSGKSLRYRARKKKRTGRGAGAQEYQTGLASRR
jgi:hypothetical protein